jgi:hypothetical protein
MHLQLAALPLLQLQVALISQLLQLLLVLPQAVMQHQLPQILLLLKPSSRSVNAGALQEGAF